MALVGVGNHRVVEGAELAAFVECGRCMWRCRRGLLGRVFKLGELTLKIVGIACTQVCLVISLTELISY